jgi:hypothetical protein
MAHRYQLEHGEYPASFQITTPALNALLNANMPVHDLTGSMKFAGMEVEEVSGDESWVKVGDMVLSCTCGNPNGLNAY